jgi:hypothetical protein
MRLVAREAKCTTGVLSHYFVIKEDLDIIAVNLLFDLDEQRAKDAAETGDSLKGLLAAICVADKSKHPDFDFWAVWLDGCVYPASVETIANQLKAEGKRWRAYMEDMGNDPQRERATCDHPPLNGHANTQEAERGTSRNPISDQYATRHNPFVYFASVLDSPDDDTSVVELNHLAQDLASAETTPNLSFISPNLCHEVHDQPCVTGDPGGLRSADAFPRQWVPMIERSEAYRKDGLLLITCDEGEEEESQPDGKGVFIIEYSSESCCNQRPGPNLAAFPQTKYIENSALNLEGFGGERTGSSLRSPVLRPGTLSKTPFHHNSLRKTLEDISVDQEHLEYAAQAGLVGFFDEPGSDIQSRAEGHQ